MTVFREGKDSTSNGRGYTAVNTTLRCNRDLPTTRKYPKTSARRFVLPSISGRLVQRKRNETAEAVCRAKESVQPMPASVQPMPASVQPMPASLLHQCQLNIILLLSYEVMNIPREADTNYIHNVNVAQATPGAMFRLVGRHKLIVLSYVYRAALYGNIEPLCMST